MDVNGLLWLDMVACAHIILLINSEEDIYLIAPGSLTYFNLLASVSVPLDN